MCSLFQKVSTRELYIIKVSENGYISYTAYTAFFCLLRNDPYKAVRASLLPEAS